MSEEKENEEIQGKKRKTDVFVFGEFSYDVLTLKHHGRTLGGIPMYEEMALQAMAQHYAFYGQLNDVTQIQGYVTRNSVIHCDCGDHDIRLDAYKDHGIMDANNEPVLTCNDCQADINIYRFGLCDAEQKYGRLSSIRPSGDKEMNKDGVLCYRCIPVLANRWMQKDGDLLIWDAGSEEFVEALKAGAYLTCRFGGKIEIIEGSENEQEQEELKWIPSYILQIDGESEQEKKLQERITKINNKIELKKSNDMENAEKYEGLKWTQEKIDKVWDTCLEFYDDYEVQVDPRMLLAIIALEGTGSFDTSSENKAADGGNGVEFDFNKDCRRAVYLLGGKIIAYLRFHNDFSEVRQAAYEEQLPGFTETDDILHYINWKTPKLVLFETDAKFDSGGYAEDSHWHRKVRQIYSDFVNLDVEKKTQEYTNYIFTLDSHIFERAAEEMGIDINKEVLFKAVKNGKDENASPNGEYTIIGEII